MPPLRITRPTAYVLIAILIMVMLWWFPSQWLSTEIGLHYLPIHAALEVLSIAMGSAVFWVVWSLRTTLKDIRLQILGTVALGVAILDFLHMFSYAGMPHLVTPSGPEKAIIFWLMARFLMAFGLVTAAWLSLHWQTNLEKHDLRMMSRVAVWLVFFLVLVGTVVTLRYSSLLPRTFIPGQGLTPFKIWAEYVLIALYVLAAVGFRFRDSTVSKQGTLKLAGVSLSFAIGELFLTLYGDVTDLYNLLGHVFKIIGFYLLYRAVFVQLIQFPYAALKEARVNLEATLETLPDCLIEIDDEGKMLAVHAGLVGQLFPKDNRHLGINIRDFLPQSVCDEVFAAVRLVNEDNMIGEARVNLSDEHQTRLFDLSISRKSIEGRLPTYLILVREVTVQVQQEQKLELDASTNLMLLRLEETTYGLSEAHYIRTALNDISILTNSPQVCLVYSGQSSDKEVQMVSLTPDDNQECLTALWQWQTQHESRILRNQVVIDRQQNPKIDARFFHRILTASASEDHAVRLLLVVANRTQCYSELDADALDRVALSLWRGIRQKRQEVLIDTLSHALGQSPYPVLITKTDLSIEYVNDAFTELSGYTQEEISGCTPTILQSGQTPQATYEELWDKLERGQAWHGEMTNRRKDGQIYTEKSTIYPVRNQHNEVTHYVAHKEDITLERQTQARIDQLSNYDQLTGLVNRNAFEATLEKLMQRPSQNRWPLIVLWLDIDHFKHVNDSLGHDAGNLLLIEISSRLRNAVGLQTTIARMSGNGFVVLLTRSEQQKAAILARKLLDAVEEPTILMGRQVAVSASIGVSQFPSDAQNASKLLLNAETAMYRVKQEGRNNMRFFSPDMQAGFMRALEISSALKQIDMDEQFYMVYQPQMSLKDNRLIGAEALLRWKHPQWGAVSPAEFIPIAEQSGRILEISQWVLRRVSHQLASWQAKGLRDFNVSVNMSGLQFLQENLAQNMIEIAREAGISTSQLEVELTESVALRDPVGAGERIDELRQAGFQVAIDDFGTGYSSMSYLKRFAVDKLKIDRSFVADLEDNIDDRAIVLAIVQMAHALGMTTIAEGVETAGQLEILKNKGCDEIQGYYYSRPLDAVVFEEFLKAARDGS